MCVFFSSFQNFKILNVLSVKFFINETQFSLLVSPRSVLSLPILDLHHKLCSLFHFLTAIKKIKEIP